MGLDTDTVVLAYLDCEAVFREHLRQANSSIKSRSQVGYVDAERAIERVFKSLREEVAKEHKEEAKWLNSSPEGRLLKVIKQLLFRELHYPPNDLGYDFSATHIGVVGSGPGVEGEIRRLANMLGEQLLPVQASPDQFWAWIGLKLESSADRLDDVLKAEWADTVRMGLGEPMPGLAGWRYAHWQAEEALPLSFLSKSGLRRYRDDPVLASLVKDERLWTFLHKTYLAPLAAAHDSGRQLRTTLLAYFTHGRSRASAAAALGVSRQTVFRSIGKVEALLGGPLDSYADSLHVALKLAMLRERP